MAWPTHGYYPHEPHCYPPAADHQYSQSRQPPAESPQPPQAQPQYSPPQHHYAKPQTPQTSQYTTQQYMSQLHPAASAAAQQHVYTEPQHEYAAYCSTKANQPTCDPATGRGTGPPSAAPPLPPRPPPWRGGNVDGGTDSRTGAGAGTGVGIGAGTGTAGTNHTPIPQRAGHSAWGGGSFFATTGAASIQAGEAGQGQSATSGQNQHTRSDSYVQPGQQPGQQRQQQEHHPLPVQQHAQYQQGYQQPASQAQALNTYSPRAYASSKSDPVSGGTAYGAAPTPDTYPPGTSLPFHQTAPAQPAAYVAHADQPPPAQQYAYGMYPAYQPPPSGSHSASAGQPAQAGQAQDQGTTLQPLQPPGPPPIPHATRPTASSAMTKSPLAQDGQSRPGPDTQPMSSPVGAACPLRQPREQAQQQEPSQAQTQSSQHPQPYQQPQQPQCEQQQLQQAVPSSNIVHPTPYPATVGQVLGISLSPPPNQDAPIPPVTVQFNQQSSPPQEAPQSPCQGLPRSPLSPPPLNLSPPRQPLSHPPVRPTSSSPRNSFNSSPQHGLSAHTQHGFTGPNWVSSPLPNQHQPPTSTPMSHGAPTQPSPPAGKTRAPLPVPPTQAAGGALGGLAGRFGAMTISPLPAQPSASSPSASPHQVAPPAYAAAVGTASNDDDELAANDVDRTIRLPPLRDAGPPSARLSCPPGDVLVPETYYHANGHNDGIIMCTACYGELVAGSLMEKNFSPRRLSVGFCAFRPPSVRRLLRVARRSGSDARAAIEAVVGQESIKACPGGGVGVEADTGITWYCAGGDIFACEQCYTQVVEGTHWAAEWTVLPHPTGQLFACDLGLLFAHRSFFKLLATASCDPLAFDKWLAGIKQRWTLPKCTGQPVQGAMRWWAPTEQYKIDNLVVCDTCYHDYIAYSHFDAGFEHAPAVGPGATCDMADPWVHDATVRVGEYGDMRMWHAVVSAIAPWLARPPSNVANDAVASGRAQMQVYYTLRGPPVDFDVCARCFHAKFGMLGVANHFVTQHLPAAGRSCDTCLFGKPMGAETDIGIGHFRAVSIEDRLLEAVHMGVWAHFDTFIAVLCTLPACRERMGVVHGNWYGFPELPVCGACWASFAAGTRLAARGLLQAQEIPAETVCALYSRSMRKRVLQWCDTDSNSPANADAELAALLDLSAKRAETWRRACKPWLMLKVMQRHMLEMAMMHTLMGIHYNTMDAINRHSIGAPDRLSGMLRHDGNLHQGMAHAQAISYADAGQTDESAVVAGLREWEAAE